MSLFIPLHSHFPVKMSLKNVPGAPKNPWNTMKPQCLRRKYTQLIDDIPVDCISQIGESSLKSKNSDPMVVPSGRAVRILLVNVGKRRRRASQCCVRTGFATTWNRRDNPLKHDTITVTYLTQNVPSVYFPRLLLGHLRFLVSSVLRRFMFLRNIEGTIWGSIENDEGDPIFFATVVGKF